jgi:hypothetical protein
MNTLSLFLVNEGDVSDATPDTEFDATNSILILAESAERAQVVASLYDAGKVGIDNWQYMGETIAAVRDPEAE